MEQLNLKNQPKFPLFAKLTDAEGNLQALQYCIGMKEWFEGFEKQEQQKQRKDNEEILKVLEPYLDIPKLDKAFKLGFVDGYKRRGKEILGE